jgi:hypothetical protein
MSTKLQIKWNLPADLNNIAASILYRAEDPNQNKSCQDVINTGSVLLKDPTAPFQNNYIDEIKDKGIYRYAAFVESHSGEMSECATFVYQYNDNVDVTIITDKNQATVQNFGAAQEDGNDLKYTQTVVKGSDLNLRDLIIPNLSEGYAIKEVYVFTGNNNTKLDGAPTITITEDTEVSVVCHKQKYTITIKRDGDYFRSTKNGEKVYKNLKAGNLKGISSSMEKDKKDCYEFDKYTAEGNADPYGQEKYDPNKSSTKILVDQNYVLSASYKEKISKLKLSSNIPEIGEVSGEGEYSCFDNIALVAKPISEKTKFKGWTITRGSSKIREGDPESVPEGLTSITVNYNDLKIEGNVDLKATFTKVFQIVLKIMGPNGIEGSSTRGSISISANDQSTSGNTITANIESINNPFDIAATKKGSHRFDGWELITGNVTGASLANSSISILSDAELHAIFIKYFTVFLRVFSTGVNGASTLSNTSLNGYDEVNNQLSLNYDTVKPAGKYQFEKWAVDLFSTQPEYTSENLSHTLDDDAIVKLYVLEIYSLILTSNIPSAVNLTGQGDYVFRSHENISISVTLNSPTVAPAYNFLNWQSPQSLSLPSAKSGTVSIVEDTTITANVETTKYTLTVSSEDNSKGTVSKTGGPNYSVFDSITILTSPKGNNIFQKWEVASSDYTLSVGDDFNATSFNLGDYGNLSLKAYFLAVYVLTVKYYEDGVENTSKQATYSRKENESSSITVSPLNVSVGHEFDRWEVQSGNVTINQPEVFGDKTIDLTEDAVIEFHALRSNELTLLIDLPGAASFSHGEANNFFRSTEDIDIELSLNNANAAIPTYQFLNDYSTTKSSLVTGLVNSQKSNTIRISGDVSITAHLDYVLYDFSATVDPMRGSIEGTSSSGKYNTLESITLKAEPIDPVKNIFKEWRDSNGNLFSTTQNTSINLADYGDLALEAIFDNKYSLNITIEYPDADNVLTTSLYAEDSDVTVDIEASINTGYRFLNMTINQGAEQSALTDLNQKFTMDKDYEIVVEVQKVFVLSLSINIPGAGSLSGAGGYLSEENIDIQTIPTINASNISNFSFLNWRLVIGTWGGGAGGNDHSSATTIRITADTEIEAMYEESQYVLTLQSETNQGTVGFLNESKSASVSKTLNATQNATIEHLASSGYQFYQWEVVSSEAGLTTGSVFSGSSNFNLSLYGNLTLIARFKKEIKFTKNVYVGGSLNSSLSIAETTLLETTNEGGTAKINVEWPSLNGYTIDRVEKSGSQSFDENSTSDQEITINKDTTLNFYLRPLETYTFTIRKILDSESPVTEDTQSVTEGGSPLDVPPITIPAGQVFVSWSPSVANADLPSDFSTWPENERITLNENLTLTYNLRTLATYTFTIRKTLDNAGSQLVSSDVFTEGLSTLNVPSIGIPAGQAFESWEITEGDAGADLGPIQGKEDWPVGETITLTKDATLTYNLRTLQGYVFTIRKIVDNGSPTNVSTQNVMEGTSEITIRSIDVPSDQEFQNWEITQGTASALSSEPSTVWPEDKKITLTDNVTIDYLVYQGHELSITAEYPTAYPQSSPDFSYSHNVKNDASNTGPYFLDDLISLSVTPPDHLDFDDWGLILGTLQGNIPSTSSSDIQIESDVTLRANLSFKLYSFTIVQGANGNTSGSTNNGSYNAFQDITLKANANSNFQFSKWEYEVSADNWQDFNASASDIIRLTEDVKIRPVFIGIPYTLTIIINDNNSWGSAIGAGTYEYNQSVDISGIPNPGYKFLRWSFTDGEEPGDLDTSEQNQTIQIKGDATLTLILEEIPLPQDGNGNKLIPILSSAGNNGVEIDRNMLAMTKDGAAVVIVSQYKPTLDRLKAIRDVNNLPSSATKYTPAIRVINKDNDQNQIEAILPLLNSTAASGGYNLGAEGVSKLTLNALSATNWEKRLEKSNIASSLSVSPDGSKIMRGGPGDKGITTSFILGGYANYYGSTEYGNLTLGTVTNINSDGDIGAIGSGTNTAGGVNIDHIANASTIDFSFSRQSSKTFYGASICIAKNYAAYSAPSSIQQTLPIQHNTTSGSGSGGFPGYQNVNPTSIFSSNTELVPNNANVIHVVPNNHLNNTGIDMPGPKRGLVDVDFGVQGHERDEEDYIVFDLGSRDIGGESNDGSWSQFGRSVDVSRDSPTLENSSVTNPIFIAITSVWKPNNSNETYTFWTRGYSITKIIGVYKEGSTIHKMGIGYHDGGSSSIKIPDTTRTMNSYMSNWSNKEIYADQEPLIDYRFSFGNNINGVYNTESDYGQKVRLSPDGSIAVISNSRTSNPDEDNILYEDDKFGEVKVLLRKPITINHNSNTYEWFEYKNVQSIRIPDGDNDLSEYTKRDFAYDIAFDGNYLAVSTPVHQTVYLYKWNSTSEEFDYWNKIFMTDSLPGAGYINLFGKAIVFDTREEGVATKIAISGNEAFFVLDIPTQET